MVHVDPLSAAHGVLQLKDVIMELDDVPIADGESSFLSTATRTRRCVQLVSQLSQKDFEQFGDTSGYDNGTRSFDNTTVFQCQPHLASTQGF